MKKIIILIMMLIILATNIYAQEQKVYFLDLTFEKEKGLTEKSIQTNYGYASRDFKESKHYYRLDTKSFDNQRLSQYFIKPDFEVYLEDPIILDKTTEQISLPYFSNAEKIEIYYKEKKIDEIDVSMYSDPKILSKEDPQLTNFIKKEQKPLWKEPKWLIIIITPIILIILSILFIKKRQINE